MYVRIYLQANYKSNEAEDPAEKQQRDDRENHVVWWLDLHEHSALHGPRLCHDHCIPLGLLPPAIAVALLWRGS